MGFFLVNIEFDESLISYRRANPPASLRLITCLALELQCYVCDHTTNIENEKLSSKGIFMHAYSVSVS